MTLSFEFSREQLQQVITESSEGSISFDGIYYSYNGQNFDSMEAAISARDNRQERIRQERAVLEESPYTYPEELIRHCFIGVDKGREDRPAACQGCQHYEGFKPQFGAASRDRLICGMHPYGPETDECEDKELKSTPNVALSLNLSPEAIARANEQVQQLNERLNALMPSFVEASESLREQIARGGVYGFAPSPEQLEQQRQEERWASEPLGIAEWLRSELGFSLRNVANGLSSFSEGIDEIARWLRDVANDLI